jgi:deoxyribonucleoside regulator
VLSANDYKQLVLVARLYYEEGKTQQEVAKMLNLYRPKVSRLLNLARKEGIVSITINDPFTVNDELAEMIRSSMDLSDVVVVPGEIDQEESTRRRLGFAGARLLEKELKPGDVLGVGWGRTLNAVTNELCETECENIVVVPLLGGLTEIVPSFQVHGLTQRIADAFNGTRYEIYMPAIVSDEKTKIALLDSQDGQRVTREWSKLTVALIGIGAANIADETQILFSEYLDPETLNILKKERAVGDICVHFFDENGAPIENALKGVIGIGLDQIRKINRVIAIAGGRDKARAILGALRGGYVNTLVTDEATAIRIIKHLGRFQS